MAALDSSMSMSMMLSSSYSKTASMRGCLLVIGDGNMDSAWSHYPVTEGGVT